MNILLINHYAGSPDMGMEFRPYYFAREWVKKGHRVDIIAADFSHIRRVNPIVKQDFELNEIDGINYWWIKTNKYDGNGAKRFLSMLCFISKLWIHSKKIVKMMEPDVVICSSTYPLDTYVGQHIRKISDKRVSVIHEVHDMWPISPIEIGGMSPKHPFIQIMQCGENSFCRNADKVISLLPASKEYFIEHGMTENKFAYVPNGVVLDEWQSYEPLPKKLSDHFISCHNQGKFNLCFFGSLHKTYNLDVLINALKQIPSNDLMVTLIGPGNDKEELKHLAEGFSDRITFFDAISKKCIPDLFNYIDASFVGAKSQRIFRFGIAMNKLFDAMMGGKPILYMVDAPNNFIADYSCGITVHGQDEKSLIAGLQRLLAISPEERDEMGNNGRKAVMERFNYEKLADAFLSVIEE